MPRCRSGSPLEGRQALGKPAPQLFAFPEQVILSQRIGAQVEELVPQRVEAAGLKGQTAIIGTLADLRWRDTTVGLESDPADLSPPSG